MYESVVLWFSKTFSISISMNYRNDIFWDLYFDHEHYETRFDAGSRFDNEYPYLINWKDMTNDCTQDVGVPVWGY